MNWKQFNFWNFWVPIIFFIVGIFMGLIYPCNSKPTKNYPIEVETYWHVGNHEGYVPMECDSVKGDTIYKDGLIIVEKNLTYIKFK